MATGHQKGHVTFFDYKAGKLIGQIEPDHEAEDGAVTSMTYLNKCLNLAVGFSSGVIKLFDCKTLKVLSIVKKAHIQKNGEGVNSLIEIIQSAKKEEGSSPDDKSADSTSTPNLPFFISGGADSMVKIFEHNPY